LGNAPPITSQNYRHHRFNCPKKGEEYNNTVPNNLKKWILECGLTLTYAEEQIVCFKRRPEYDPEKHVSLAVWVSLLDGRSYPSRRTAWKVVRFLNQYTPHQTLVPADVFPLGCYPHPEETALLKTANKKVKKLLNVTDAELEHRRKLSAGFVKSKRGV